MKAELFKQIRSEVEAWHQGQQNQEDGYLFEESFVEMWRRLGQDVLQSSMQPLPKSRNQKKD